MTSRRIRPLKAYKHFRKLIADKEDTTQVFNIVEALDGSNPVSYTHLTLPTILRV